MGKPLFSLLWHAISITLYFYMYVGEKEVRTEGGKIERKKSVIVLGPEAETGIVHVGYNKLCIW